MTVGGKGEGCRVEARLPPWASKRERQMWSRGREALPISEFALFRDSGGRGCEFGLCREFWACLSGVLNAYIIIFILSGRSSSGTRNQAPQPVQFSCYAVSHLQYACVRSVDSVAYLEFYSLGVSCLASVRTRKHGNPVQLVERPCKTCRHRIRSYSQHCDGEPGKVQLEGL